MENHPCDLLAILFDGMDKIQHIAWPSLDPAYFPEDPSPWDCRLPEQEIPTELITGSES